MKCNLCPRACNVDRGGGARGYCGESDIVRVARTSLHQWEEPCITGKYGSGTVFFSGCSLKCIFCQNHNIADGSVGQAFTVEELAEAFLRLQENRASNINLVTAGHFVKQVAEALVIAKERGLTVPVVYNSSAYETVESLQKLRGLVDVYLPDCKYYSEEIAGNYAGAPDYFKIATAAIGEMVKQVGEPVFDEKTGNMIKGVIVRHLVLPGHTKDSMEILKYLHEAYGNRIYVSIMNQYTPVIHQDNYPNLNRCVTKREYCKVLDYALSVGMENAFFQEGYTAKESFIPNFDCTFV